MTKRVLPEELKITKIVPILKKGDESDLNNYRPIVLVPVFSKIFEAAIKNRLVAYLQKNNVICQEQHGYRKGRSTVTTAVEIIESITAILDEKQDATLLCCDLSKAFDCVDVPILLHKLCHYGIREPALSLIKTYLSNRKQLVAWKGALSQVLRVDNGVPQGSVLGPLLFLIYVNDLVSGVQCGKMCLYADDTTILVKGNIYEDLAEKAETAVREADEWLRSNGLSLNNNKTQNITISTKVLPEKKTVCFLGLHVSGTLDYKKHISSITSKLSSVVFVLRRLMEVATYDAARTAYFALFHSILIWGHTTVAKNIFLKQKETVRILSGASSRASCRSLFRENGILTLACCYVLSCVSYIHTNGSRYVAHCEQHQHNTRGRSDYVVPYHRVKRPQMSTNYLAVKLYNHLPQCVKSLDKKRFQTKVKSILLQKEYYTTEEYLSSRL